MELCSIASGSNGNCIYVGTEDTHLLVDVGISGKRVEDALCDIDIDPSKLSGILITHEHSDHISGLGVMARKHRIPIYATVETVHGIFHGTGVGKIPAELFCYIEPEMQFSIGDISVSPFSISHDAANPVGYTFEADEKRVGVATDIGCYDDYIVQHLTGLHALLIEANHDVHMLEAGSYPYYLKRRILGDKGHLSNENSGILLSKIWNPNLKQVFLGHLSEENNFPDLAYETVRLELMRVQEQFEKYTGLAVAKRGERSEPVFV